MNKLFILIVFLQQCIFIYSQENWYRQYSGAVDRLENVFFLNQHTGWIAGMKGTILKTTNGGINWESNNLSQYHTLGSIYFINENTGWLSGGYNYISILYKTTSGGTNWDIQLFDVTGFYVSSLNFVDENTGFMINCGNNVGWRIQKTTDGGIQWINLYTGHYLSELHLINTNILVASGCNSNASQGAFLKSTNGGLNWYDKFIPETVQLNTLYFINDNTGWGAGIDGVIVQTTDGGNSWRMQKDSRKSLNKIHFVSESTGWAVGFDGILKTTNAGTDWGHQNVTNELLWCVYFINPNTGWSVGQGGKIYKTTNSGGSIEITPHEYILKQNYPNPFNPATNIEFSIAETGQVKITIFDITGREVAIVAEGNYFAGFHTVRFNAASLASGVYFYKISTSKFTDTKKMVFVK